ncbi:MAG: PorT family protein [Prevotella sp.]|nr:PorT family protein [Prevotella sp.]
MRRIILITTILMSSLTLCQAQIFNEKTTKRIGQAIKDGYQDIKTAIIQDTKPSGEHTLWDTYVTPKAGLNVSNLPGIDGKMKIGLVAGAYVEVFLRKNLALDMEMEYSRQGSAGVYSAFNTMDEEGNTVSYKSGPYDYKLDYLNTNYLVRWYPWADLPCSFVTGLHMGRVLSAHSKLKHGDESDIKDQIRNGDLAIPIGAAYEWKQWQAELRYNLSFRHLASGTKAKQIMGEARNSMLEVTIGYRIKVF